MRALTRITAVLLALLASCFAQDLKVAAASDLSAVLPTIVRAFEQQNHCTVEVSYGSSGNFYQQLRNGAPFDAYLSADVQYPQKLEADGLTLPGTLTEYAAGKLVLWSRNDSRLDLSRGLALLTSDAVHKIAIANPQHAPYGKAAQAALERSGVAAKVASKLVLGENVSQTAVFVQSGNADVGLIPLSLALTSTMQAAGHFVELPASEYPPIRQAAVALKSSPHPDLATKFIQFLAAPASRDALRKFGFALPGRAQ